MPPNASDKEVVDDLSTDKDEFDKKDVDAFDYNQDFIPFNALCLFVIHASGLFGLFYGMWHLRLTTFIFFALYGMMSSVGITVGVHRFWAHKCFKANLPLRIILMVCYATAGQWRLVNWAREHRLHHKYTETIYDPVNAKRGLFFAHCGWLMKEKHPLCEKMCKTIDVSDVHQDSVARFYDNNFYPVMTFFCFIFPTLVARFVFNETWLLAYSGNMLRYMITLSGTFFVNSLAHNHVMGKHPYNKFIGPTDHVINAVLTTGEGWHNFHHTFPWDYRSRELGVDLLTIPTNFIDFFAKIGWAYDLKTASSELILKQAARKGDGSRFVGGVPIVEAAYQE